MTAELRKYLNQEWAKKLIELEKYEKLYDNINSSLPEIYLEEFIELLKESGATEEDLQFVFSSAQIDKIRKLFESMGFDVTLVKPNQILVERNNTKIARVIANKGIDVYFTRGNAGIRHLGGYNYPVRFPSVDQFLETIEYNSYNKEYIIKPEHYSKYIEW